MSESKAERLPGISNRFKVKVIAPNEIDLGTWAKADGLSVTFDVIEHRTGDAGNDRWFSPGASTYEKVKLSRIVSVHTRKVRDWLSQTGFNYEPGHAVVTLMDTAGKDVMEWEMRCVMPAKWSVSGFDATNGKLAVEQLDLMHLGFLDDEQRP